MLPINNLLLDLEVWQPQSKCSQRSGWFWIFFTEWEILSIAIASLSTSLGRRFEVLRCAVHTLPVCESYKQFSDHSVPRFTQIAAVIQNRSLGRHTRSAERIRPHIQK